MRMWMVDPGVLCRRHLNGEHGELHKLVGSLRAGRSVRGHIERGQSEPQKVVARHAEVAAEMGRRGMRHASPLGSDDVPDGVPEGKVDPERSLEELWARCPDCRRQRGRRLADRIDAAWRANRPEDDTSTYGSRKWIARLAKLDPRTVDKHIRGVHPPTRTEATLDLIEER